MADPRSYLAERRERHLGELLELLRIPSISALPEHAGDVRRAAEWVAERLRVAGLAGVRLLPTGEHPVVYGEWLGAPGRPTVLVYGHFDVQPVDPLHLWSSPPFEPTLRDGRIYARGASDMKGNLLAAVVAVEALLRTTGALPVNVKVFFEGMEEVGSAGLPAFVAAHRELLACDLVVNLDGAQWSEEQPALLVGLRGICGVQLDVRGARSDLHSGVYGGAVQNPLHALAALLASCHAADGSVAVAGFYDDVEPLSAAERARLAAVPFDEAAYRAELGVDELFGEAGYTTLERSWARPTLEVNGAWGGFQGEGIKTVLPSEAHAKITCRLVVRQDPDRIVRLLTEHVVRHAPPGVRIAVTPLPGRGKPYLVPADHPGNLAASAALRQLYGREPVYTRMGGSVPVSGLFLDELGAYTVTFGFSLLDERFHAPDEFFRVASYERAQDGCCLLLSELGAKRLERTG